MGARRGVSGGPSSGPRAIPLAVARPGAGARSAAAGRGPACARGRAGCTGAPRTRRLPGAEDFDIDASIRLQALDQLLVVSPLRAHLAAVGHRLALALALGLDELRRHTLVDQVGLHRLRALLRKLLVE